MGFTNFPPTLTVTGKVKISTPVTIVTAPTEPIDVDVAGSVDVTGSTVDVNGPVTVTSPLATSILKPATSIVSSQTLTGTGVAKQITGTGTPLYGLILKARKTNAGPVYIGGATVNDPDSFVLTPGEVLNLPPVTPVSLLWFIATAGSELSVWAI